MSESDLRTLGFSQPPDAGPSEEEELQAARRQVISRLALCLKQATIHALSNQAMLRPIAELVETLNTEVEQRGSLRIQSVGENFFLDKEIVKLNWSSFEAAQGLRSIFKRLAIGEITINARLDQADLLEFLDRFQEIYRSKEPQRFVAEKFAKISTRPITQGEEGVVEVTIDERQNVLRGFALLSHSLKKCLDDMARGRSPRLSQVRRSLQTLADASVGHEALLVGLTRFPKLRGELHYHLTSVGAFVLLMARRLGLRRRALSDLVMASLVHDIGRAELESGTALEASTGEVELALSRVPLVSGLRVTGAGLSAETLGYLAAIHEVTQPACPSDGGRVPAAMARLISVPCVYDLLTLPTSKDRLSPDQAMASILAQSGKRFDPTVARLFASIVGLFPIGTTVELTSGEIGVVVEVPTDASLYSRPRLRIIKDSSGSTDYLLDLAHADARVTIKGEAEAAQVELNPVHLLLA